MNESINRYTEGVSKKGIDDVVDNLKLYLVKEAKEILAYNNEQVIAIEKALRDMWKGDDCERYIRNFGLDRSKKSNELQQIYTIIENTLYETYDYWKEFQSKNVE